MPPRRAAARKSASKAPVPAKPAASKTRRGRSARRTSTDENSQSEIPVEVKPDTTAEGSDTEGGDAEGGGAVTAMDRDRLIDIADEVYHAHDYDDEEDEMEEEWENSFDVPRIDFYFTGHTSAYQRTLVYRTALLFSGAPPSAPLHVDEYVEEWVSRCNVGITGSGGPLTMEEEAEYHMAEHQAIGEARAAAGMGAEEEEAEVEGEEEEESERKPYMLVFPSAKRVIDFIAYLGTDGLYNIWMQREEEGEELIDEEEYEPRTRLWWRMNESEWIPAHC